jgi:hypothetical protein
MAQLKLPAPNLPGGTEEKHQIVAESRFQAGSVVHSTTLSGLA